MAPQDTSLTSSLFLASHYRRELYFLQPAPMLSEDIGTCRSRKCCPSISIGSCHSRRLRPGLFTHTLFAKSRDQRLHGQIPSSWAVLLVGIGAFHLREISGVPGNYPSFRIGIRAQGPYYYRAECSFSLFVKSEMVRVFPDLVDWLPGLTQAWRLGTIFNGL